MYVYLYKRSDGAPLCNTHTLVPLLSDMIALPDFRAGAMENWGLITYRESAMLYYDGVASEANKQRITNVITHELAHQVYNACARLSHD